MDQDISQKRLMEQQSSSIHEPPFVSKYFHFPRVLLILLVVFITVLIFLSLGYYWGKSSTYESSTSSLVKKVSPMVKSEAPTPTQECIGNCPGNIKMPTQVPSDWKTFTMKNANISFKYPPGWSVVSSGDSFDPTFGPNMPINSNGENYLQILSDKNFALNLDYDTTKNSSVNSVRKTASGTVVKIAPVMVNNQNDYIVVDSQQNNYFQVSLTDTASKVGDTSFKNGINITRANLYLYGHFGTQAAVQTTYDKFISDPDVNNALLIISSLKY